MRWFFRSDFRSFYLLNVTQFLGALNDNLFKFLVVFFLVYLKGPSEANTILSLAGAIFVIPWLLFSSSAGVLADRISKRTIIVSVKMFEVLIMIFGLVSVYMESEFFSYTALFLMATHSAIFGPSKYGIIPELVESKMVSKANGTMSSFTYLGIILGSFLASLITQLTERNFLFVGYVCLGIAVLGLLASLGINRTAPQNSPKKFNPIFIYEIYQTLRFSWKMPHMMPAIFGSAFFLFIGGFTQLNLIPFAMQALDMSAEGGGYLFVAMAVGIALGAFLSGQLSKDRVEPGISCIAGVFISVFFVLLFFFSWSLVVTILILTLLGIAGGAYLIPFDSFIQVNSPDEKRGQVIAASNFFSFIGVLFSSATLYMISEEWGFSAASGFAIMGVLTAFATIILTGRLSALFFPFFIQKVLKRIRKLQFVHAPPTPASIILLQNRSWWDAILLFGCFTQLKILLPTSYFSGFPWINGWFESFRIVPPDTHRLHPSYTSLVEMALELQHKGQIVCIYCRAKGRVLEEIHKSLAQLHSSLVYVHVKKEKVEKSFFLINYEQKLITFSFSKTPQM